MYRLWRFRTKRRSTVPKLTCRFGVPSAGSLVSLRIRVDFAVPARCDLSFVNRAGESEIPICLHRAPLGTHERMIGFLLEHYAGKFPVWLSPEHARVIPINDSHNDYAQKIAERLREAKIRAQADLGPDRMNAKIRQAQLMQVPYMLVVGDRES